MQYKSGKPHINISITPGRYLRTYRALHQRAGCSRRILIQSKYGNVHPEIARANQFSREQFVPVFHQLTGNSVASIILRAKRAGDSCIR